MPVTDVAVEFHGILFPDAPSHPPMEAGMAPEFFADLNLDQVVTAVTAGREQYDLAPFFYTLPTDRRTIRHRQEVFRDLEEQAIAAVIGVFSRHMELMRGEFAEADKRYHARQKQWGFLQVVTRYCGAVEGLTRDLQSAPIRSRGLGQFADYLSAYQVSGAFRSLSAETQQLRSELAGVGYRLYLHDNDVEVSQRIPAPDYGAAVDHTFAKFRQHAGGGEYHFDVPDFPEMNHVEAAVLEFVAQLHPAVFRSLEQYCERHRDFLDRVIAEFDRQVQFYLAYLEHMQRLQHGGLPFCYPEIDSQSKAIECRDAFDLALAGRLSGTSHRVVPNDLELGAHERVVVVSGANQGGKTTFARMCGQLHYLGRLGCPVPGRSARLFHFDRLFTHFEREEDLRTLRSKLEDDLTRIQAILQRVTADSLLIMNESFSSATLGDALLLSGQVMQRIVAKDLICVFVTFLDELASFGETVVSMTSMVDPQDVARRTFKVVRRPADGLAYAMAIAQRYGLTYESIKARIGA